MKKNSKSSKENDRHVSILSNISKVYEKFMFKQISEYLDLFYRNISVDSERDRVLNIVYHQC